MIRSMLIGEIEQKTYTKFKSVEDFETYINDIDIDYHSKVIFTGLLYKSNKRDYENVKRSQYDRSTDFGQDIVEYTGNNCSIPTRRNCFIRCIKYLTGKG